MVKLITVHAFRGGTGKSKIAANVAAQLVLSGKRVGLIDGDLESPGLHTLFEMDLTHPEPVLNDYLWGRARIESTVRAAPLDPAETGSLSLVPASMKAEDITRILREGYDISLFYDGYESLVKQLHLDYVLMDTHSGLSETALLWAGASNLLLVVLRPDRRDLEGTSLLLDTLRRKLDLLDLALAVNMLPGGSNAEEVRAELEHRFAADVAALLPLSDEVARIGSSGLFSARYPDHPWSQQIGLLANRILRL